MENESLCFCECHFCNLHEPCDYYEFDSEGVMCSHRLLCDCDCDSDFGSGSESESESEEK